ncbi:MAG: hypothetical protein J6P89_10725 [Oscillospiraceae bacterium]|nr:hypothetical protein [Oscillospiraceae bacterium]
MKMKKTLSLIAAIALLASMTSCGQTNDPQNGNSAAETGAVTTAATAETTASVSETAAVTSEGAAVSQTAAVTSAKKEEAAKKSDETPKTLPKASEKVAEEKLSDFFTIDALLAGFIKTDESDSVTVSGFNYYRVLDGEKISSIDEFQKFIKNTLSGSLASENTDLVSEMYVEKDGKLYAREAGRGSLSYDLSQGVVLSDVTDRSFTATPNEYSTRYGTGVFKFTAEDNEWKILSYELLTGDNGETEEQSGEAVQKMNTLSDLLGLFSGIVGYDESESIESGDRTFYRVTDITGYGTVSGLKTAVNNTCTGELKDKLLSDIENNFIEKDDTLYVWILPASYYIFRTDGGVSITEKNDTSFKATTNDSDDLYGQGTAHFVLEDGEWLISDYSFS